MNDYLVCEFCNRVVAHPGTDSNGLPTWETCNGSTVQTFFNQAPRIKCACGKIIVLLEIGGE